MAKDNPTGYERTCPVCRNVIWSNSHQNMVAQYNNHMKQDKDHKDYHGSVPRTRKTYN